MIARVPTGVNGRTIKLSTLLTGLAVVVTLGLAGMGGMRVFGQVEIKVASNTQRVETVEQAITHVAEKVGEVAEDQAATRSTVEAIQQQQRLDRDHLDDRLDVLIRAINGR